MKKSVKVLVAFIICLSIFLGFKTVSAKEVVYTNDNGVELDQNEFNFFKKVYGIRFLKYLDQDILDEFESVNFENPNVESNTVYASENNTMFQPRDNTFFSSPAKSITISKVVTNVFSRIYITVNWLAEPNMKSYDDIGAYLDGPTRISTPVTHYYSTDESGFESAIKYDTHGYGAVVDIPTGQDVSITQNFAYTGTGVVYASYQHAMTTSTLTIAQKFNISAIGYGGVFDFYGEALDIYDDMNGVNISV